MSRPKTQAKKRDEIHPILWGAPNHSNACRTGNPVPIRDYAKNIHLLLLGFCSRDTGHYHLPFRLKILAKNKIGPALDRTPGAGPLWPSLGPLKLLSTNNK